MEVDRLPPPPPPPPPPAAPAAAPPPQRPLGMLRDDLAQYGQYPATNNPTWYDNGARSSGRTILVVSRAARCRRPRLRQIGVGRRRACFRYCIRARVGGSFTQKPATGSGQTAGGRRASASTSPPRRRLWRCRRRTTGRALPSWCSTHMRSGSTSPPRRRLWRCRRTTGRALPSWCSTHMRLPVEAGRIVTQLFMQRGHLVVPSIPTSQAGASSTPGQGEA